MPEKPGKTLLHYRLIEKLGEGGMGVVWRTLDLKLGREVALKLLRDDVTGSPQRVARFRREAGALAAINHPGIVTIYSVEQADGLYFYTMELVEGAPLNDQIAAGGLSLDRLLDLAIPITEALEAAHRQGVAHRDLKPGNIMVTRDGRVKLLDFGLAKVFEPRAAGSNAGTQSEHLTEKGDILGTYPYMSPEQLEGEPADYRSDIFSLGVTLYEMATGRRPFPGASPAAVISAILRDTPPPIARFRKDLPIGLDRVLGRCLEKLPARRPQSVAEVRLGLEMVGSEARAAAPISDTQLRAAPPARASARGPSIAVLPFANLSGDPGKEYFGDGIAEELINALARIGSLRVVARTSSFTFKGSSRSARDIGRELNADTILEGGVRIAGTRLRITAQLIDAADGCSLWSESFDREMADIFAIQDEVALAIIENLKLTLATTERDAVLKRGTEDIEAYDAYLKGIHHLMASHEGYQSAVGFLEDALARDPGFAAAYYGLAVAYGEIAFWGRTAPSEAWQKVKTYARKALALDETVGEAHAMLSMAYTMHDWNFAAAEREARLALQLSPNAGICHVVYSYLLIATERFDQAVTEAVEAQLLDPLSRMIAGNVVFALLWQGRFDRAIEEMERARRKHPDVALLRGFLGLAYRSKGMYDQAIAEYEKAVELSGGDPWTTLNLGLVYHQCGKKAEAEKIFAALSLRAEHEHVPPLAFCFISLARGKLRLALTWLDKAGKEHDSYLCFMRVAPRSLIQTPDEPKLKIWLKRLMARLLIARIIARYRIIDEGT